MTPALKKNITVESAAYVMRHSSNYFQNNFTDSLANASHKLIDISLHAFLAVFLSPIIAFFTLFSIHKFFAFGILVWTI